MIPLNLPHQDTIFGGFAPNSGSAEVLSKSLGSRTVMSGSISRGKNDPSQSLQMMERPLMTPDELKALKKGRFIVTKTGAYPMQTVLKLFLDWGITFGKSYEIDEQSSRKVEYADKDELIMEIINRSTTEVCETDDEDTSDSGTAHSGMAHTPVAEKPKRKSAQPHSASKTVHKPKIKTQPEVMK